MTSTTMIHDVPTERGTPWDDQKHVPPRRLRHRLHRALQLIRRTHLYLGLFLFPWAILYGITGFLFNHPTFLADAPTVTYQRKDLAGTPLELGPHWDDLAASVITAVNEQKQPSTPYQLVRQPAPRWVGRDSFVATVKADQRSFFITYDPRTSSGIIRETTPRTSAVPPAPFATGKAEAPRQRGMGMMGPMKPDPSGLKLADSPIDHLKAALSVLMLRKGFPAGEITVTTAPDLQFSVLAEGQVWRANFNPLTTSLSGVTLEHPGEFSWRTFLLRMHLTRGYPGEVNTKWFWAVGVDAIALTLCFWGCSGLLMWWQIKATRRSGWVVLLLSLSLATALGIGMHGFLAI